MPVARVNGISMHYELAGSGTPLLLIHGLGGSHADWQAQIDHFAARNKVIAPDLRGHGRSDAPAGPYRMAQFSDDLAALLESLKVGAAHVVGISLGGGIAFQFALDHPSQTRTLTVVNSGPAMILRTWREKLAIWQRFAIVRLLGLPRMGEVVAGRLFPQPESAALRAAFVERFKANRPDAYLASLRAFVGWSVRERIGRIGCPTLIVAADQDYSPVAAKEEYVRELPNAKLVVIPDARHALPMERPREFNGALGEFLAAAGSAEDSPSAQIRRRTLPVA